MEKDYSVGIKSIGQINLDGLAHEFESGSFHDIFKPTENFLGGNNLLITTDSGEEFRVTYRGFRYAFANPLEQQNIFNAIKSALDAAKILANFPLTFNTNLLSLYVGHFAGEETFEREFGTIAGNLQRRLYRGGDVGYAQSSNDYNIFLGTEQEIGKKQGILKIKKIEVEGTAQPANSLDELLGRLEQK